TQNLQETSALNLNLRDKLNEQVNLVYLQFERVDPAFPDRFSAINFQLGEQWTLYLKLNIGTEERLTVERIKTFQSEFAIQALQLHHQLQSNDRAQAVLRLRDMQTLEKKVSIEFGRLNTLQVNKLRDVQGQLGATVLTTNRAIYALAIYLLLALLAFSLLLRHRVLKPLRSLLAAANQVRQ